MAGQISEMKARVVTSKSMPTWGNYYTPGDIVYNIGTPVENGTAGKKYIVKGWKRITSGSSHVLNVDWFEMRVFTGN